MSRDAHKFNSDQKCNLDRVVRENGAVKDDGNKPMMHLFPPDALLGAAEVMSQVVRSGRYPKGNWTGLPPEALYDAAMRHLLAMGSGEVVDKQSGLPHADHLVATAGMLRHVLLKSERTTEGWYSPTTKEVNDGQSIDV